MRNKAKKSISAILTLAMALSLIAGLPLTANAAAVDVSGSYVIDNENGSMTLTVKGALPIAMAANDYIQFMPGGYDFLGVATVTSLSPVEVLSASGGMFTLRVTAPFTIPTTGIEATIAYTSHGAPTTGILDISGSNTANYTIPIYHNGTSPDDFNIALDLNVSNVIFSPDWEGNLFAQAATVTVTALDAITLAPDTTVNGRVVLYTENGPITLLNSQSYLYADMVNGVATATISKLFDMGALISTYSVDLTAAMPLYDAGTITPATLSITPNPLSITGTVKDDNNNPIDGATVCLVAADGYMASRTLTDAAGHYLLYGSPRSSSYRVIAYTDELYGEETKNLLPQPAVQDITLYSEIKITVNFYRNKATLDGTPNSNVISPDNLYEAGTYKIEAYANSGANRAIAPIRTDGRDAYFRISDIQFGGDRIFVKATPLSVYQDPFVDNSSALVEVDYKNEPDPYNIVMDLEESPVGTITVKNTGSAGYLYVIFEKDNTSTVYAQTAIPPGGQYSYTPPEGYALPAAPVRVLLNNFSITAPRERCDIYYMIAGLGRADELSLTAADLLGSGMGNTTMPKVLYDRQVGDMVYLNVRGPISDNQYTVELPDTLELPSNWRDYVTLTVCEGAKTLNSSQIKAVYDPAKNTLTFAYESPYTSMVRQQQVFQYRYRWVSGWSVASNWPNQPLRTWPYYTSWWQGYYNPDIEETYHVYAAMLGDAYLGDVNLKTEYRGAMVVTFAATLKTATDDITTHHGVLTRTRYNVKKTNEDPYFWLIANESNYQWDTWDEWYEFVEGRYPLTSFAFTSGWPLSLDGPANTNTDKVFVQGYAKPGAVVTVSAEGFTNTATFTANQAGRYSGTFTLPKREGVTLFSLIATSGGKTSNKLPVRQTKRLLYTKELWMDTTQSGVFSKTYMLINSTVRIEDGTPAVVDLHTGVTQNVMMGDEVKFRVKMSDDSAIQKVFVAVERGDGTVQTTVPCQFNPGSGYWESETLDSQWSNPKSFRVTYVLNLGHEYMSPADIEADMQSSEAAMVNWTPPERMFIDPVTFNHELQIAMLESMPPELRGASYYSLPNNGTRVEFTSISGVPSSFTVSSEAITGADRDALAARALVDGIRVGDGRIYSEISYDCTLTGGGTITYEGSEFDDALYNMGMLHPGESTEYLLTNRMDITKVNMETLTYTSAALAAPGDPGEAVRHGVEVTSGVLSSLGDIAQAAGANIGPGASVVNAAATLLSIPDTITQVMAAREIADSYFAMLSNLRSLMSSECYQKLDDHDKGTFVGKLRTIEAYETDFANFKSRHTYFAIGKGLFAIGSSVVTLAPGLGVGVKVGVALVSQAASNADLFGDREMYRQLLQYKALYETLQELNEMLKRSLALACGEKQSDKALGNYKFIYDPQGIVYNGAPDYPVAGVRAELWTGDDGVGTNARYWNEADDYDQINPQITEDDGMFSWFTPEGWWQVRVFDDATNAQLGASEWLKVLPPHYGVNINIGGEPLTINYDRNGGYYETGLPDQDVDDYDPSMYMPIYPQTIYQAPQGGNHTVIDNEFSHELFTFVGWNTTADGAGTLYQPGDVIQNIQSDMNLYAQWATVGLTPDTGGSGNGGGGGGGGGGASQIGSFSGESVYRKGSGEDLVYIVQKDFTLFKEVMIDGNPLEKDKDYTVEGDPTKITILAAYLETLSDGEHTLTAGFTDGATSTAAFTVEAKLTLLTPEMPVNPFTDVKGTDWFIDAVIFVYAKGLMLGTSINPMLFSPQLTMTRGMVATVLYRMGGSADVTGAAIPFSDVAEGLWYTDAIKWAAENDIVNGYGDGRFGPADTITREQLVTMLYNYCKWKGADVSVGENTNILSYNDAFDISEYAIPAFQWACGAGVILGKPGNLLDPKGHATRAECATVLMRFYDIAAGNANN